ncbi:beta-L-arabinofuranosidase domain-containing protein [Dysgonomonas sp. 216]|uniref:beta-L-arabinofuranosidase domain-containing protein n=1 Tax=Dysgonomonas sp. 216 TaxID=2302934 RepID=UPI00162511C4|nr:beta-L-arabinofuranosidase domain-containing protein [Dysgonomonas sp. 216]
MSFLKNTLISFLLLISFCPVFSTEISVRTIAQIEPISIECPKGTVPRLPYQVWTTYSDGKSEYRQVKWSNSALTTELSQADPALHPVGNEYTITGFITGDNKTPNGYPITAKVRVVGEPYHIPSKTVIAEPIPLNKVTITGDNRLTSNRELAIREIMSWDVSQQLYNYRDAYGLSTDGYTQADGWDSPTTKLKGHGSGHYMSALAFAFASTTNPEQKNLLRNNITRMVNELRECQERTFIWDEELGRYWEARDFAPEEELRQMKGTWEDFDTYKTQYKKYGYGYLNAIPAQHPVLIEMYRAYNNSDWVWAPYYSIHKQLAGLIDIATYIDDKKIADKALLIAKDMGLWIWNRLHYRTYVKTDGSQDERRTRPGNRYEMWNIYIAGEDGGTGESLARLSEMVSNPTEKKRLLEASTYFDSPAFYDPLSKNIDDIRTRHANQHIPKITSALRSFRGNQDPYYYNLAENFWEMIQGRYRYSSGGVGNGEMFRQPYTQILSMATNVTSDSQRNLHPSPHINETCCAYNLAKLTKDLNCFNPDDARYMDYYERILYNQLVGSLNHTHYQTTYHYAVGLNASKAWGNHTPQSTCCGGTGSENHVKYQESAYFVSENNNTLWVALYMPTILTWDAQKITIQQECLWPAEQSSIKVTKGKGKFNMKLRVPYWATEGFDIKLNGVSIASYYKPGTYATIPLRNWTNKDVVEITMPFTKHIDYGPDKMEIAATAQNETNTLFTPMWAGTLMYGPLAMTATDVDSWHKAIINIDSHLNNVVANKPDKNSQGAEGNVYSLTLDGKTFLPDYYRHKNSTHYFRINVTDGSNVAADNQLSSVDIATLKELLLVAEERKTAQEVWNTLVVKVPEHSPWAPYGYRRLIKQLTSAAKVLENETHSQPEVNAAAVALNAAINTMRPGNLPELEDLDELLILLERAKKTDSSDKTFIEAIEYTEMVVKYVGDGSGTHDMIANASKKLKIAFERMETYE